jgi:transcription elongation GreA/GreB family factor
MKETLEEKLSRLKTERDNMILQRYTTMREFDRKIKNHEEQIERISQEIQRIQIAISQ